VYKIYTVYFANVYKHEGRNLGVVDLIMMSLGKIHYDPEHPGVFRSLPKLVSASKNKKCGMENWLSSQNTYTLHKPPRKEFPRNPYTVTNIDDVWEMDFA